MDAQSQPLGSRYLLDEPIGHGAMGTVWRAKLRETDERVAVKLLRPELAAEPDVVARFVQERTVLLKLRHPHLVPIRDMVIEGDALALVMDLVDGDDLRAHLRAKGTVTPAFAAVVMSQVADALVAVHAEQIVHRDLKPANVLLERAFGDKAPRARLTDFGVAKVLDGPGVTAMTTLVGTPEYLAPELVDGGAPTPAADVYAAGVMLYELLAGRTPYAGGHPMAVLRRHTESSPEPIPDCPPQLWRVIDWCMAKEPTARPNASDLANRLRQVGGFLIDLPALAALPPLTADTPARSALAPQDSPTPSRRPSQQRPAVAALPPAAGAAGTATAAMAASAPTGDEARDGHGGDGPAPEDDGDDAARPRKVRLLVGAVAALALAGAAVAATGLLAGSPSKPSAAGHPAGRQVAGAVSATPRPGAAGATPAAPPASTEPVARVVAGHTVTPAAGKTAPGAPTSPASTPAKPPATPSTGPSPSPTPTGPKPPTPYACLPAYHYAANPKVGINACSSSGGGAVSVITMAVGPAGTVVDLRAELHDATTGKVVGASHQCKNVVLAPNTPHVCGPFVVQAAKAGQKYAPEAAWRLPAKALWTTILGPLFSL